MSISKFLVPSVAAVALMGAIGFAGAQTNTLTNPNNSAGTMNDGRTSDGNLVDADNASDNLTSTTSEERVARVDRN